MTAPNLALLKVLALKQTVAAKPTQPVVNSPDGGLAVPMNTVEPTDRQTPVTVADPADMMATSEGHGPPDYLRSPTRVGQAMQARAKYARRSTWLTDDWLG